MLELAWGAGTHTGLRRKRNEDAYLARPPLFAVADGMGGHARGDVAATLAIESLESLESLDHELAVTVPPSTPSAGIGSSEGLTRAGVLDAVRSADRTIAAQAGSDLDTAMGTTVCGLICLPDDRPGTVLIFNVGDSRVYRHRPGDLTQLTHDHSVVQELIDEGRIDEREAATHPERNVITRSLGSGAAVDIDWWTIDALPGDQFLLCSDGLVREVSTDQVAEILAAPEAPQEKVDRLIVAALEGGGRDNVTVVVVEVVAVVDLPSVPGGDDLAVDTNPRPVQADTNPRLSAILVQADSRLESPPNGQQPGAPTDARSMPDPVGQADDQPLIDLADVPGMDTASGDLAATHTSNEPTRP